MIFIGQERNTIMHEGCHAVISLCNNGKAERSNKNYHGKDWYGDDTSGDIEFFHQMTQCKAVYIEELCRLRLAPAGFLKGVPD